MQLTLPLSSIQIWEYLMCPNDQRETSDVGKYMDTVLQLRLYTDVFNEDESVIPSTVNIRSGRIYTRNQLPWLRTERRRTLIALDTLTRFQFIGRTRSNTLQCAWYFSAKGGIFCFCFCLSAGQLKRLWNMD